MLVSQVARYVVAGLARVRVSKSEHPKCCHSGHKRPGQQNQTLENEMPITIDLRVADCMTRSVVSVSSKTDLTKAIGIMDREGLSALPVVDDVGCVCGILSNSDLVQIAYDLQCDVCVMPHVSECVRKTLIEALSADNAGVKVTSAMTAEVETISDTADIAEAAVRMIDCDIHHLPVVDESKKPIGIIATTDIVRAIADARKAADSVDNVQSLSHWEDDGGQNVGDDYDWLPVANGGSRPEKLDPRKP